MDSLLLSSSERARHSFFIEALGAGGFLSINYDNRFIKNLSWRVGVGIFPFRDWFLAPPKDNSDRYTGFEGFMTIPLTIHILSDGLSSPGHLEAGTGIVFWFGQEFNYRENPKIGFGFSSFSPISSNGSKVKLILPLSVGYRYQMPEGGFFFRAGLITMFNVYSNNSSFFSIQLSIGSSFF